MMNQKVNKKSVRVGWALLRVSTTHQADVQHGSLEQQKNMTSRWAKEQSEKSDCRYHIERFIEEDVSGGRKNTKNRGVLRELELAIENRSIDFFIVEKLDRLTRDQVFNLQIARKAQQHGVEMFEYESGLVNLKDRGSRLSFNVKNMLAEDYIDELKEKVTKKGREARFNNGKDSSSAPILGLDRHPTRVCVYTINKDEQKIAIDIYAKFLELGNLKALEDYCKQMGYKTKERMTKSQTGKDGMIIPPRRIGGKPFDSKSLRYLLSCHKLRGYSFFEDTWAQFSKLQNDDGLVRWEYAHFREDGPVVPLELYDQVQKILDSNKHKGSKSKTGGEIYLLSGILFKANGEKLVGASAKGGDNLYYEDRIRGKCGEYRIPKEEIERAICGRVSQYLQQSGLIESVLRNTVNSKSDELDRIEDETKKIKGKILELQTAVGRFSDYLRSAAMESVTKLDEVCKTINQERKKAEEELALATNQLSRLEAKRKLMTEEFEEKTIREYLKAVWKDFEQKCSHQKKQLIQAIIPKIVVHPDDRLEIVLNPFFRGHSGGPSSGFDSGGQKFLYGKIGWGGRTRTCE